MTEDGFKSGTTGENLDWAQPYSKLHIPLTTREYLERPRLRSRLDAARHHKMILVSAPAGYGKTALVSHALAGTDRPVAWLSLDRRNNDLIGFWTSLIVALQKLRPGLGETALAMIRFGTPSIESALVELVNEIEKALPDLIIVLDDYHEINVQAIHDSVTFLIEYLPPQVRLIILSRGTPPMYLARLRGRGNLAEIRTADLQFTREETQSFLNEVMGLGLSREQVCSIHDRTEGWIAGLQMAALSIQERRDAAESVFTLEGTNRDIMEYLAREVLEQQEGHVRAFLLQTCILDRLTESLCNAVTGRDDSQQILEKLVTAHLFLQPLDDEGKWFRYHQLFSELLRKELEAKQPGAIPALHGRASEWYQGQGLIEDAIEHALAAEDFERAAGLIQHIALRVLGQDKHSKIQDWLARLPKEFVTGNLQICILGAINGKLLRGREPGAGEPYLQYAQSMNDVSSDRGPSLTHTVRGFLALINSVHDLRTDIPQAIKTLSEGLESLPEDQIMARCALNYALGYAFWGAGDLETSYRHLEESIRLSRPAEYSFVTIRAATALACIRFAWGHLNSAAEACREAIEVGTNGEGKESSIVSYARMLLGEILYQWNSLDESKESVMKAILLIEQAPEPIIHLNANMGLARIAIAQGKSDIAMATARRARTAHGGDVGQHFPADIFLTRLWLMAGNASAASDYAHTWSESLSALPGDSTRAGPLATDLERSIHNRNIHDIWSEIPLLTFIRLRLAQGNLDGLLDLLDNICRRVEEKRWTNILIEALILKALVLHAERKVAHALRTLDDVLAMTELEGYVRIFVDEGLPMYQLLQRAFSRGMAVPYVYRLLKAFNMPDTGTPRQPTIEGPVSLPLTPTSSNMAEPLTRREVEVLELIARGSPNRDIAQELVITLETVKKHLRHVYQKLDVNNRSRAIIRAREMGLLEAAPPKAR